MDKQRIHNVREFGRAGGPVIVTCSMLGWPQNMWFNLANQLRQFYHVITYDNVLDPDHFDARRHNNLRGYSQDLIELLGEMGITSCVFLGHSISGFIGAVASQMQPRLFSKLIMINPTPSYRYDRSQGYNGGFSRKAIDEIIGIFRSNYEAFQAERYSDLQGNEAISSAAGQELCGPLFHLPAETAFHVASTIFNRIDARSIVSQIQVPCVILQSNWDLLVPRSVNQFLLQAIPEVVVEFFPVSHHSPHFRDYQNLAPVIHRHL